MSRDNCNNVGPWYKNGLRFSCTQCGDCCRGEPGFVWVKRDELPIMADHLNISVQRFLKRYCRQVMDRISLIEYANGDCVFYSSEGCKVYDVRPAQCRQFPFWKHIMASPEEWEKLRKQCPGINQGRLYSQQEIEAIMKQRRET
ncbi:MAG: YkgJ family cysteine cluster protein [Planctomycetota bacterium]